MKFDDLDRRMRVYETSNDHCVLPGIYMVARLDGRGFTKLTKQTLDLEAPFDVRFQQAMVETVRHLMQSGFQVRYGYCQSDEISLLFSLGETCFGRKIRKYNSVLAGEASAAFSLRIGACAAFDCRLAELPRRADVVDYYRWRSEDAVRNALSAHCYWLLRRQGETCQQATDALRGMSTSEKNELLFRHGINFNDLPTWQRRGFGVVWEDVPRQGVNPITGDASMTTRRQLRTELELPCRGEYDAFLEAILDAD